MLITYSAVKGARTWDHEGPRGPVTGWEVVLMVPGSLFLCNIEYYVQEPSCCHSVRHCPHGYMCIKEVIKTAITCSFPKLPGRPGECLDTTRLVWPGEEGPFHRGT